MQATIVLECTAVSNPALTAVRVRVDDSDTTRSVIDRRWKSVISKLC